MKMEPNRRLSIKRVEISLNNFNDIAIPHHIDLLKKHKANIIKYQNMCDLDRIKNEQINATRIVVQLRHLLEEMDILRQQVAEQDLRRFDTMTERSRKITYKAIKEYMDMPHYSENQSSPSLSSGYSSHSPNPSQDATFTFASTSSEQLSLEIDEAALVEEQIKQQESCSKTWETLQDEVQDLHEIFVKFQDVIDTQKKDVRIAEENVETASYNVQVGTETLARTERMKGVWYPFAGAVIGGCIAGPIGLLTGLKVGGLALLGGSAVGFTGGRLLKRKKEEELSMTPVRTELVTDKKDD